MFTATIEPIHPPSPVAWRGCECLDDMMPDHHTGHSLHILQDREFEENGPSALVHI